MGIKLEYWFLLTKISVLVLDVMIMIEDGVSIPALDDSWWILWHVGGGIVLLPTFSNLSIFQNPISNLGLGFGFSNSPKIPPNCRKFVQSPILYLENYNGGNLKLENPNIFQLPKILPIHPKIS